MTVGWNIDNHIKIEGATNTILYGVIISCNDISLYTLESTENPCVPNPCMNGGNCKEEKGNFTCDCQPGFEGDTCEISRLTCIVRLLPRLEYMIYSIL